MKLYSYFRSSAAFRVRIALNIKGLEYDYLAVNLLKSEQKGTDYMSLNPQGLVPALVIPDGDLIAQSVAILEWLEETHPTPPLLPADPLERARVRSVVNAVTCDMHPLCNLAVTNYLKAEHDAGDQDILNWYTTWMHRGFFAIEQVLAQNDSQYSFGDQPCMADLVLVPQIYNARRFKVPLENFPHITRVVDNCNALPAFAEAAPEAQPDSTIKT
jgi:maleylacetoacetate isomerase